VSSSRARSFTSPLAVVVAADAVAGAADAGAAGAESADADAESADADAELDAGGAAAAAAAAAAERGVCLGVGADPGANRKQCNLKSAIVGAGENRSDPALSFVARSQCGTVWYAR